MISLISLRSPRLRTELFAEDEFYIPLVPYFEHDRGTVVDTLDGLVGGALAGLLFCLVLQPLL
jgi:hypothetical protein